VGAHCNNVFVCVVGLCQCGGNGYNVEHRVDLDSGHVGARPHIYWNQLGIVLLGSSVFRKITVFISLFSFSHFSSSFFTDTLLGPHTASVVCPRFESSSAAHRRPGADVARNQLALLRELRAHGTGYRDPHSLSYGALHAGYSAQKRDTV
jgi:hypothetical protein